jgi:hypothetical protein
LLAVEVVNKARDEYVVAVRTARQDEKFRYKSGFINPLTQDA